MSHDIEVSFNRALQFSYSPKKWMLVFPVLVACGLFIVLCRALAVDANYWVGVSLAFFPSFVAAAVLMAAGVLLIRIYYDEVKGRGISYRKTIRSSWGLIRRIVMVGVSLLFACLGLWICLGIFYLLKGIPEVGHALGVVFSFGPFLLILGSLMLSIVALLLLFFLTPKVALDSELHRKTLKSVWLALKSNPYRHGAFVSLGLLPLLLVIGLLVLAAILTGATYVTTERTWAIALQWFFIMIPFAGLLSPAVVFFFNFSAESFVAMERKGK